MVTLLHGVIVFAVRLNAAKGRALFEREIYSVKIDRYIAGTPLRTVDNKPDPNSFTQSRTFIPEG